MKRVIYFSFSIVIVILTMISCQEDKNIPVTGLNSASHDDLIVLVVGNTYEMNVSVEPTNATEKGIVWTSSNSSIASVLGGVITAKLPGIAEIVATSVDGTKSVSVEVIVTNPVVGIVFGGDMKIAVGEKVFPKYGFAPPSATDKSIRWTSSDESIATINVNTGEIIGLQFGKTIITGVLVSNESITGNFIVEVMPISVTGVTISPKSLSLETGTTATLTKNIIPANANNQDVTWSTSDASIATVNATTGLVTGVKAGEATITVTTLDGGFTDFCMVTVIKGADKTKFVRVDANLSDWTGEYLIVYEPITNTTSGAQRARIMAFNGGASGPPVNAAGNVIDVIISGLNNDVADNIVISTGGEIVLDEATSAAKVKIVASGTGGWTIQTGGGFYIGGGSAAGSLNASDVLNPISQVHEISIGEVVSSAESGKIFKNYAIIKSEDPGVNNYLRINGGTGRFGYWASTAQQPVALYRLQ